MISCKTLCVLNLFHRWLRLKLPFGMTFKRYRLLNQTLNNVRDQIQSLKFLRLLTLMRKLKVPFNNLLSKSRSLILDISSKGQLMHLPSLELRLRWLKSGEIILTLICLLTVLQPFPSLSLNRSNSLEMFLLVIKFHSEDPTVISWCKKAYDKLSLMTLFVS